MSNTSPAPYHVKPLDRGTKQSSLHPAMLQASGMHSTPGETYPDLTLYLKGLFVIPQASRKLFHPHIILNLQQLSMMDAGGDL